MALFQNSGVVTVCTFLCRAYPNPLLCFLWKWKQLEGKRVIIQGDQENDWKEKRGDILNRRVYL